jgi:hypothetical protein
VSNELVLVDIDLAGNALLRATLEALASPPSSPLPRQMYYDTTLESPRVRNQANNAWITLDATKLSGVIPNSALATNPLDRSNHFGTQLASTISNFDSQVRTNRLDQMTSPTSSVDMNGQRLTGLGDPISSADAATRSWVLTQVQASAAGIDSKPSVRFGTTGNITLSGLGTQSGGDWSVAMNDGDAVLVKNQTNGQDNGIYIAHSGAWTRRVDADTGINLNCGAHVVIEEGVTLQTTSWILATLNPITVGTTPLVWNQFSASSLYTAGNGISVSGNQITVVPASGGGISVTGSGVSVDASVARTATPTLITGDSSTTQFTITHNQNKKGFPVFVTQAASPYALVRPGITYDTVNTFVITFNVAPATGTNYKVDWVA